jgi:phosphatidylinositol alpha-1,6-mannosyltransferase
VVDREGSSGGARAPTRPASEDAVVFTGRLSDEEHDRWLDRAHVFVIAEQASAAPGSGGEGFGIVFIEPSLHALPVVAGLAGGAVDAVIDGHAGLLVDLDER